MIASGYMILWICLEDPPTLSNQDYQRLADLPARVTPS